MAILQNLLELNPYYRKPISELLKSPIFDKIRVASLERPAEGVINMDVDRMDGFDYENHTDYVMGGTAGYRKAILKEIKKIKQDRGLVAKSGKTSKPRYEK